VILGDVWAQRSGGTEIRQASTVLKGLEDSKSENRVEETKKDVERVEERGEENSLPAGRLSQGPKLWSKGIWLARGCRKP